jgi:O-antigen ligase
MEKHPFVGAGYLTHDPRIQIFDNAYNKALVEFGLIGFAMLILFFLSALVTTWRGTTMADEYEIVLPAVGVIAVLSLLAAGATFDAWTFDQFFPSALILLGVGLGRSAVIFQRERVQRGNERPPAGDSA